MNVVEQAIARLEGATQCLLFASGMAAITNSLLALLKTGEHVIMPNACYGGTHEFMDTFGARLGLTASFVDGHDAEAYRAALTPQTRVLYAEVLMNPTMRMADLTALGALGKEVGAKVVVDATFASPYHVRCLAIAGVDVVLHSCTKYLGGHSDVLAGCVASHDTDFLTSLTKARRMFGPILPAMDAYLLARGLKTLDVRMERHAANALRVAEFLEAHDKVEAVYYPGLASHPDHARAEAAFNGGYGGMMAFEVKGGSAAGRTVADNLRVVNLAVSLGSVESLIEHAATMTHTMVPREERLAAGISDGLLRLSVGLEAADDLIADLGRALDLV